MELKHIEEFLEIAECGNFLESADNLDISQSALSKHIQTMEKELGTKLFNRTTRKVFLSEGGKVFYPFAQQLNEIYYDMQGQIKEFIAKDRMKLNIGCIPILANYGVIQVISDFKKENPKVEFNLIEYNNYVGNDMSKSLLDFEYDLAFYAPCDLSPDRFETIEFCEDHLVALLPADHPLCVMKKIELKLLAREKLLLMDRSTPIYDLCHALFCEAGFEPNVVFLGVRIENFIEMVSKKMGIAILIEKHISGVNKNYAVIREIVPTSTRTMSFVRVKNRHHSAISGKFWNYIKEHKNNSAV